MGCSTSTLDDDPHPSANADSSRSAGQSKNGQNKTSDPPVIKFDNTESQGNKFISNDDL